MKTVLRLIYAAAMILGIVALYYNKLDGAVIAFATAIVSLAMVGIVTKPEEYYVEK